MADEVHLNLLDNLRVGQAQDQTELSADAEHLRSVIRRLDPLVSRAAEDAIAQQVVHRLVGLGPLEGPMADPTVSEVMVNGPGRVWVERSGVVEPTGIMIDQATVDHLVERIVASSGRRLDRTSPLVELRLADGSRVHVAGPPVAVDGPFITIRRFGVASVELSTMSPPDVAELLAWSIRSRSNVVVSGGTGAGKTTLLNSMTAHLGPNERVVTVEDAAELQLDTQHVVRLEARPPSVDGPAEITIRDLVRAALRMRPDRIIVGECRGAEAFDMIQAMNTGHIGSLSTLHANSAEDALRRLASMLALGMPDLGENARLDLMHSAVDLVVQVERVGAERRVVEVLEPSATAGGSVRVLADASGLRCAPSRRRSDLAPPDPCAQDGSLRWPR